MQFIIHGCWVSKAISNSCPVSPSTVEIVDNCPDSEEKWRQAAARKNCAAYSRQCDKPEQLDYHCVINAFVNETLEVCAYRRIIVLGFCTEYSFGGNIIQQNIRTNCTTFTQNPCPLGYPSTDSYKYPDCYKLTKKVTTRAAAKTTPSTIEATDMNSEKQADEETSYPLIVLLYAIPVTVGITFTVLIAVLSRRLKNKCRCSERKEHFLKPENGPKQDCQTQLGLERLAVISSENRSAENQPNLIEVHRNYYDPKLRITPEATQKLLKIP